MTDVDLTIATASRPGRRSSSSAASRVMTATTRAGAVTSSSTRARKPSISTARTTPRKRLRALSSSGVRAPLEPGHLGGGDEPPVRLVPLGADPARPVPAPEGVEADPERARGLARGEELLAAHGGLLSCRVAPISHRHCLGSIEVPRLGCQGGTDAEDRLAVPARGSAARPGGVRRRRRRVERRRRDAADRVRGRLADGGLPGDRPGAHVQLRRLRRAGDPDHRGRAGRRLRGGQLEVPAAALRGGARRGAGHVRVQPARPDRSQGQPCRDRGDRGRRRARREARDRGRGRARGRLHPDGAGGSRPHGRARQRRLERGRRQGRRRQDLARRRATPGSSTRPTPPSPATTSW